MYICIFTPKLSDRLGHTQPNRTSSPRVKRPGREFNHSSPSTVEVKNEWSHTFTLPLYIYIYVCMYLCGYVCMCLCMYVCMHVFVCVCMYVCMYLCVCVCIMYVCMHVYMYVCIGCGKTRCRNFKR